MKYETPELTALTPAVNAIQQLGSKKIIRLGDNQTVSAQGFNEHTAGYADWE